MSFYRTGGSDPWISYAVHFNLDVRRKLADDGRAGRFIVSEEFRVGSVHRGEVGPIGEINPYPYDFGQGRSQPFEYVLDAGQNLMSLFLNGAFGSGNLAGQKQETPSLDSR